MAKKTKKKKQKMCEVVRAFSYKLNCGNYSTADFFCSQKVECPESEAEKKSKELYQFCKEQVIKSVAEYQRENQKKVVAEKTKPIKLTGRDFAEMKKEAPARQAEQELAEAEGQRQRIEDDKEREVNITFDLVNQGN